MSLYATFPKAQSAISSHQKFVDAQNKTKKDLELYTKIKSILSSGVKESLFRSNVNWDRGFGASASREKKQQGQLAMLKRMKPI